MGSLFCHKKQNIIPPSRLWYWYPSSHWNSCRSKYIYNNNIKNNNNNLFLLISVQLREHSSFKFLEEFIYPPPPSSRILNITIKSSFHYIPKINLYHIHNILVSFLNLFYISFQYSNKDYFEGIYWCVNLAAHAHKWKKVWRTLCNFAN